MNRQPARRSSLFLLELIIAILFFSLAATVCVRLFVKSHTLEKDSVDLNHAVTAATSVAEIFRSQDDADLVLQEQFPDGKQEANSYSFFYDEDWMPCTSSEAVYTVFLHTEPSDPFLLGMIEVRKGDSLLYQLNLKKYAEKEEF